MKIVHDIILCCLTLSIFQTVATIEQKVFKNVCTLVCKNNSTSDAQCNSTIILQAVPSIRPVPYTHTISVAWISQRLYLSLEVQQRQAPSEDAQRYHITGQRYLQYGTMYIQYREASREYWLRCGVQLSDRNETTLHPTTSWGGVKASWGYMVITTPHHTTHTHTHTHTRTCTRTHTRVTCQYKRSPLYIHYFRPTNLQEVQCILHVYNIYNPSYTVHPIQHTHNY